MSTTASRTSRSFQQYTSGFKEELKIVYRALSTTDVETTLWNKKTAIFIGVVKFRGKYDNIVY